MSRTDADREGLPSPTNCISLFVSAPISAKSIRGAGVVIRDVGATNCGAGCVVGGANCVGAVGPGCVGAGANPVGAAGPGCAGVGAKPVCTAGALGAKTPGVCTGAPGGAKTGAGVLGGANGVCAGAPGGAKPPEAPGGAKTPGACAGVLGGANGVCAGAPEGAKTPGVPVAGEAGAKGAPNGVCVGLNEKPPGAEGFGLGAAMKKCECCRQITRKIYCDLWIWWVPTVNEKQCKKTTVKSSSF